MCLTRGKSWCTKCIGETLLTSCFHYCRRPKWTHETPLRYAVLGRQREAVAWLVGHGADGSVEDEKGWSAGDMAEVMDDASVVGALVSREP
jgi:hypothetical protein